MNTYFGLGRQSSWYLNKNERQNGLIPCYEGGLILESLCVHSVKKTLTDSKAFWYNFLIVYYLESLGGCLTYRDTDSGGAVSRAINAREKATRWWRWLDGPSKAAIWFQILQTNFESILSFDVSHRSHPSSYVATCSRKASDYRVAHIETHSLCIYNLLTSMLPQTSRKPQCYQTFSRDKSRKFSFNQKVKNQPKYPRTDLTVFLLNNIPVVVLLEYQW